MCSQQTIVLFVHPWNGLLFDEGTVASNILYCTVASMVDTIGLNSCLIKLLSNCDPTFSYEFSLIVVNLTFHVSLYLSPKCYL